MLTDTSPDVATFKVKYAGLVQDIRGDIDPSGRTDLLKILDQAKLEGQITAFDKPKDFSADDLLEVTSNAIFVSSVATGELLLRVPIHSIASVGFVREDSANILPIKIGEISSNRDSFDLAVLYCANSEVAGRICKVLGQCFSQVYEAARTHDLNPSPFKTRTVSSTSPTTNHRPLFLTDSHPDLCVASRAPYSTTASRSESADDYTDELIKEYMTMLTACLTTEELAQYAGLILRWREGSMPIIELAQKLSELYGPRRNHLLLRMRCLLRNRSREDVEAFDEFIEMLNCNDSSVGEGVSSDVR